MPMTMKRFVGDDISGISPLGELDDLARAVLEDKRDGLAAEVSD